jgi:hypothetical protein
MPTGPEQIYGNLDLAPTDYRYKLRLLEANKEKYSGTARDEINAEITKFKIIIKNLEQTQVL